MNQVQPDKELVFSSGQGADRVQIPNPVEKILSGVRCYHAIEITIWKPIKSIMVISCSLNIDSRDLFGRICLTPAARTSHP
jgi:hypothetical protein